MNQQSQTPPRDFDKELVDCLKTLPGVLGVYRVDIDDKMLGHYVVRITDPATETDVKELVSAEVDPELDVSVLGAEEVVPEAQIMWEANVSNVDRPTLAQIVQANHESIIENRNGLMLEENIAPLSIAGFVIDISDPLCPEKFISLAGGQKFIKHCRAGGRLPIASGVLPRDILIRHIDPIARRVSKMPAKSPIFLPGDALDEPRIVRALRNWNSTTQIPVVTIYEHKMGLSALIVPTIVAPVRKQ